jgi:hypothetical protein
MKRVPAAPTRGPVSLMVNLKKNETFAAEQK